MDNVWKETGEEMGICVGIYCLMHVDPLLA